MVAIRLILALTIALSVAILPAAGGRAAAAVAPSMATMLDCPHHHSDGGKAADKAACLSACAVNCFQFVAPVATALILSDRVAGIEPSFRPPALLPHTEHFIFRPPRA
jgi:hypothetical protein